MKSVVIGTAGHIDHGKSALVEALTGTHPDRLEEERRRGITIDLGFAHLTLPEISGHQPLRLSFVDVPGHERFVRNMLAGVGGIDLVLLVIAADEGVKPQTREHFEICRLLGIPRGLIVLSKTDLVEPEWLQLVESEVRELVQGSFLENAAVVPVSARTGAGIEVLKNELRVLAEQVPGRDTKQPFRLPIDRAFTLKGFGTVVTGTLLQGEMQREQPLDLLGSLQDGGFAQQERRHPALPGGLERSLARPLRSRGLHVHGEATPVARAGQRTAVNLAAIEPAEIRRGMTLAPPGLFRCTVRLDVRLQLLPGARPLKSYSRLRLHIYSLDVTATVVLLEADVLAPGASALAQLRLHEPVLALPNDRFVLRQISPAATVGGGTVLRALARRPRQREKAAASLRDWEHAGWEERVSGMLAEAGAEGLAEADLIAATGLVPDFLHSLLEALRRRQACYAAGQNPRLFLHANTVQELSAALLGALHAFHSDNPLSPGPAISDLEARTAAALRLRPAPSWPVVFRFVLHEQIEARKIEQAGEIIRAAGRQLSLTPEEAAARDRIESAFRDAGLRVPPVPEVLSALQLDQRRAQKLLQLLLRDRVLVRVNDDLLFHSSALDALRTLLLRQAKLTSRLNVAAFKELTGVSRKYAIPLLEHLDRLRWTRRVADEREILLRT